MKKGYKYCIGEKVLVEIDNKKVAGKVLEFDGWNGYVLYLTVVISNGSKLYFKLSEETKFKWYSGRADVEFIGKIKHQTPQFILHRQRRKYEKERCL